MTAQTIEAKIAAILQTMRPDSMQLLEAHTNLFEANLLDSFGAVEFISALEKEFEIAISNDDLVPQNIWSVAATAKTIEKYLK